MIHCVNYFEPHLKIKKLELNQIESNMGVIFDENKRRKETLLRKLNK